MSGRLRDGERVSRVERLFARGEEEGERADRKMREARAYWNCMLP